MAMPLSHFAGWTLEIECRGSSCPKGRNRKVDAILKLSSTLTVIEATMKMRCIACGQAPESVVLVQSNEARRLPLRGPECRY